MTQNNFGLVPIYFWNTPENKALFFGVFQNFQTGLKAQKFSADSQNININVVCDIIQLPKQTLSLIYVSLSQVSINLVQLCIEVVQDTTSNYGFNS